MPACPLIFLFSFAKLLQRATNRRWRLERRYLKSRIETLKNQAKVKRYWSMTCAEMTLTAGLCQQTIKKQQFSYNKLDCNDCED